MIEHLIYYLFIIKNITYVHLVKTSPTLNVFKVLLRYNMTVT